MSDITGKAAVPTPHPISVEFYTRKGNREEDIINSNGAVEPVDGKSRWFNYSFVRPVYLTGIEVKANGYENYDRFEIVIEHVDGTQHEEKVTVNAGSVTLRLGKLSRGFRFKPDRKYIAEPRLLSVVASGFTENEFHAFELAVKEYEKNATELKAREERLSAQIEQAANLRTERSELEAAIGRAKAESEQLNKGLEQVTGRKAHLDSQLLEIQKSVAASSEILSDIQSEIDRETAKRNSLVRELRLFPSEISGFVREGNRSIKWYLAIGTPFAAILATIVYKLFSNAVELTQLFKQEPNIDIWVIFWTRLPFVLVAVALIETCGYVVGRLVFEIVRINRQRLEFAKLSIIAKDVSTASATATEGMTEDEVFQNETKLKMELLREHMKNYVGSEFEYKGSGLIAAIKGVAERFSRSP